LSRTAISCSTRGAGRAGLPRLFLDHFRATSLIAEDKGTMTGFLAPPAHFAHRVTISEAI
jgi:hypothetical protein